MSVLPSRFLRFRFLPRDRLWRRPAFPALILPEPVMRKRFTALRFVFNFGILQVLPWARRAAPCTRAALRRQAFGPSACAAGGGGGWAGWAGGCPAGCGGRGGGGA